MIRNIVAEEIGKALTALRNDLKSPDQSARSDEDLYAPPRHVAVKFPDEEARLIGERILFAKTQESIGLRAGIHLIWEKDLTYLDRAGIKYARYYPKSSEAREIYEAFGIK